jgi:hypothetical protein
MKNSIFLGIIFLLNATAINAMEKGGGQSKETKDANRDAKCAYGKERERRCDKAGDYSDKCNLIRDSNRDNCNSNGTAKNSGADRK